MSIPLLFASSCLSLWKDSYLLLILASKNLLFLSGTHIFTKNLLLGEGVVEVEGREKGGK